jgi:hypothetical protein
MLSNQRVESRHLTPLITFRSEMPYQGCARASVIYVCVDVGADCHGDVSVAYPACDDPRVLHHQGNVNGAAWKSYHESSACPSSHQGSCSSISKCVAAADVSSPSPPHRPKGSESGACGAWTTNLPRHVSTAAQSGSHGSVRAPRCPHHHPCAVSSSVDLPPHLTRAAPNSAPCACARDPTSHPGHAPIAARVPQLPPPARVPCGPHALGPRVPCEFQRQKGLVSEGCSCYGHPYYE